jgi:hypothetical protein
MVAHRDEKFMEPISAEKKIGERECRVTFCRSISQQCELNIHYQHKGETWIASKKGSLAEIAEFIELAIPNIPDTKLINSALEELSSKIPEEIL